MPLRKRLAKFFKREKQKSRGKAQKLKKKIEDSFSTDRDKDTLALERTNESINTKMHWAFADPKAKKRVIKFRKNKRKASRQ